VLDRVWAEVYAAGFADLAALDCDGVWEFVRDWIDLWDLSGVEGG
jgi:hypothetical protein